MNYLVDIAVLVVALLHLYFMILEIYFWEKPLGLKTFNLTPEFAKQSKTLALNQGLYNGFLAVGLILGLLTGDAGNLIVYFLLGCVVVAGIVGAATANIKILWIQAMPAIIALILWHY